MSKYSEFVKAHMAKHKMTWSCAVCEIKKDNLYKKGKAPEKKAPEEKAPEKKIINISKKRKTKPVEDDEIPPGIRTGTGFSDGLPNNDYRVKQWKKEVSFGHTTSMEHTSVDKKVLPAPPVRIPHIGTLGALPIELGSMIQDFIRPTEEMLTVERKRKLEQDILDYVSGEAKKYFKFKMIYKSIFELHPRYTSEWAFGKDETFISGEEVGGGHIPDYLESVKKEMNKYDAVFKKHIREIKKKLHTKIPKKALEPSNYDMSPVRYNDTRYRDRLLLRSTVQDIIKSFEKWLEKSVSKAQLLERSIEKIPQDLESKVDLLLEKEE